MEERLEEANVAGPLASPHNWHDMESLVVWCRAAAALQPDGTDVPATRCEVCVLPVDDPAESLQYCLSSKCSSCQAELRLIPCLLMGEGCPQQA